MTLQEAIAAGYTKRITAENAAYVLDLMVWPDADLDGSFRAYDLDEGQLVRVSGWCFDVDVWPDLEVGKGPAGWDVVAV
jgi:hypothetical protein